MIRCWAMWRGQWRSFAGGLRLGPAEPARFRHAFPACSTMSTLPAGNRRMVIPGSACRAPSTATTSCRPTGSVPIPAATAMTPLTYTPRGFLWTAAEAKGAYGQTVWRVERRYQTAQEADGTDYSWSDFYNTVLCKGSKGLRVKLRRAGRHRQPDLVDSVRRRDPRSALSCLSISPSLTSIAWITGSPRSRSRSRPARVPNLTILWLPNDHTNGTNKGFPYPINYQADNDLALGRMVEAISHSKIWGQSAIFIEEDDSQNGVDPCRRPPPACLHY